MVEDGSSMVLNTKFNEISDSGHISYQFRPNKRSRHDHNGSSPRFKGVVPQQNGHWGAQIYANHQRIWLGTFKSDKEAAAAYDSAAIKLRTGDTHRNLPWTDHNIQEPDFQSLYSTEDVLDMIREGTYQAKLDDFVNILSKKDKKSSTNNLHKKLVHGDTQFSCMQLFQKELTPSDVGKLNRLVIPKKHAVKHFPQQSLVDGVEDVELVFYDRLMVIWKFRFCYWRSSQSYVFTRGWSRFVKEKRLKEKDIVSFYTCECPGGDQNGRNFFLIDVDYNGESCCVDEADKKAIVTLESSTEDRREGMNLGKKSYFGNGSSSQFDRVDEGVDEYECNVKKKNVTLFGVRIN